MNELEINTRIQVLIDKWERLTPQQRKNLNEAQNCKNFILPLFKILDWDVYSDEVSSEENIGGKRADYTFRLNGVAKFFLEAKKPSIDLRREDFAEQAISYAWHKSVSWAILTNFETLKVFNAEWDEVNPERSLVFEIRYADYLTDKKLWLLSREAIENGELDRWAEQEFRKPKRENVDTQLAKDLLRWRNVLFGNLKSWNSDKKIDSKQLAKAVQALLDRLIFMRTTEDRGIENEHLRELLRNYEENKEGKYDLEKELKDLFKNYDKWYDSRLFEKQLCDELEYENSFLKTVVSELYKNTKGIRYNFAEINADVLGSIYEQYLGQIQQSDIKNSKRKQQGIYYTPRYIVDFIVRNTVGELTKKKLAHEITKIKILDPACGSGSFLTRTFETINQSLRKQNWDNPGTRLTVIPQSVYGVDLDDEAVEIAQLNLLLRMVYQRERLPNLTHNIECGNSLISGTETELKKKFGARWKDKKSFNWQERFMEVFQEGGFDAIIGNPPYIKEYVDKSAFDGLHESPYYQGKMDIWTLFACQAIDHLKEGGYFSFIAPNNWLTNAGASVFRDKILKEGEIIFLIDFGDFKVFKDAGIQTMIFVFRKGKPRKIYPIKYARVLNSEILESAVAEFLMSENSKSSDIESFITNFSAEEYIGKSITFSSVEKQGPLEKIRHKAEFQLGEDEVAQGIVGDPDKAFTFDGSDFNDNEKDVLKKYFTSTSRYAMGNQRGLIAYLDKKQSSISALPRIQSQLEKYKDDLENRREVKSERINWFQLHWPRDEKFFKKGPKIVCGIRVQRPSFYYTEDEYYGSRALNFIKTDRINLKYLTAILNSRVLYFWFLHEGKRLGDLLQIDKGPLLQVPVPIASTDIQKMIIRYVDNLKKRMSEIIKLDPILCKEEVEEKRREFDKIDAELDVLIYKLYGLTPEEIRIVEKL